MSSEQEPVDVTLVQDAEGRFLMAPLFDRAILAHTDPDQAETAAQSFAGRKQPWVLVPSAVRAAEQERLPAFEALAERARVMCEYGVTPQVLVSLRDDLAALAPPAQPEGGPE